MELGEVAWVTAQLNKREKYLSYIRERVNAGTYRLTAALAKFLGLPFEEDGAQLVPRVGTGTFALKSAHAEQLVADGRRLAGSLAIDRDTGLPIVTWRKDH